MTEREDQADLIAQLRNVFLQHNSEPFDPRDVERIKTEDRAVLAYLKNTRFDLERALNMMVESLKWRKSFEVNDLTRDKLHPDVLVDPYLFFAGKGKSGDPILIFELKTHKKNNPLADELKKMLCYLIEHREGAKDYRKLIMVFNMSGCGFGNIDYDFIKFLISLLTEYYPDILDHLLIFEMPRLLSAAWTIIRNMLDEDSRDAIKFVNKTEILEYADKDNLIPSLGGTAIKDEPSVMEPDFQTIVEKKQVTFNAASETANISSKDKKEQGKMPLLVISPLDTLSFTVMQSNIESVPQTIRMTNTRDTPIAYKVKTTAPEHYRVKPTVGVIEPGKSVEVSVQLTPGSAVTASRDRFLVQSTAIPASWNGDISEFWRGIEPSKVTEHRLRCKVTMNGSPIEDKMDLNANPPSINDRLFSIDNKLAAIEASSKRVEKQVKIMLAVIQVLLIMVLLYTSYVLWQEYQLLQESETGGAPAVKDGGEL